MAYASIYHLSAGYIPHYLDFLRKYKPAIIMGYPNALNLIAKFAVENNNFPAPARAIFTTSETVTEQIRANLEMAWNCKVYDRYGAVENCMFASQCEYGKYHVSPDVGILGEVVCTGLHNTLQPLIRYQIGDAARWSTEQSCMCGRDWPVIEGVEGRFEDICVTKDGREVVRFDTVFKGVESIKEGQVIQETLDRFVIKVVPEQLYSSKDAQMLKDNMKKHVGEVDVDVQIVETIARTSSGKFRAVICKLRKSKNDNR